jgi:hypothetical protein
MKLSFHSLKGKVRQNRGLLHSQIDRQVNLSAKYVFENYVSVDNACQGLCDKFEILLLASSQDLPLAIENAKRTKVLYGDRVVNITVISQSAHTETIEGVNFFTDEQIGISNNISKVLDLFGNRAGWMKQQYLKSKFVHQASNPVLIVDSDTYLQVAFNWIQDGKQLLLVNTEDFHTPYNVHITSFLGITPPFLNFVSHVQLQNPAIVREIYSSDFDKGWEKWARASWKFGEDSPASEFQTYAVYLLAKAKEVSIVFPNHKLVNAENKSLREVLDSDVSISCHIVTVGQKLKLISDPY